MSKKKSPFVDRFTGEPVSIHELMRRSDERKAQREQTRAMERMADLLACQQTGQNTQPEPRLPTHAPDFTSVDWYGTRYTFAKGMQAEAVRVLYEAWAGGGHSVGQEAIGERIGSAAERFRLAHVFRDHPAWGVMIQPAGKGVFRLAPPEKK